MANRVLVLGAHPDDAEFGCGGTIARFVEEGREVYSAIFSLCEKSIPQGLPQDILLTELTESAKVLGISSDHLFVHNYEVRNFPAIRQKILEDLVAIRKNLNPDLVLLPSMDDLHQDHHTLAEEGLRAFKGCSILGYEQVWNNFVFRATSFLYLEERHILTKIAAIECYKSQAFRIYSKGDFIFSLAKVRGTQINTTYAEAFEGIRFVFK